SMSHEMEEASAEPPGLEMDALDELEEDMQLFGDLSEHSISPLEEDTLGGASTDVGGGEESLDSPVVEGVPTPVAAPRSVAAEAVDSAWEGRPLSERLAGGSLVVLGIWAVWKVWSVL
ncbi:MAG: hypothetical protein VX519_05220, partial [Myxococcota bacterium]|nr:hypothetical protein [Myxococcota bacterium]